MSAGAPAVPTEVNDRAGGPKSRLVREAPTPTLLVPAEASAAYPDAPDEPVLRVSEIQGNIVAGFNKDFQTLIFLRIDDAEALQALACPVRGCGRHRRRGHRLQPAVQEHAPTAAATRGSVRATWINIAFTHAGLAKLTGEADQFTDTSFRSGMVAQSAALGDPTAADAEGNPRQWLVRDGERRCRRPRHRRVGHARRSRGGGRPGGAVDLRAATGRPPCSQRRDDRLQGRGADAAGRASRARAFRVPGRRLAAGLARAPVGQLITTSSHRARTPMSRKIRESPARTSSGPASSSSATRGRTQTSTSTRRDVTRSATSTGIPSRRNGRKTALTSSSGVCVRTSSSSIRSCTSTRDRST